MNRLVLRVPISGGTTLSLLQMAREAGIDPEDPVELGCFLGDLATAELPSALAELIGCSSRGIPSGDDGAIAEPGRVALGEDRSSDLASVSLQTEAPRFVGRGAPRNLVDGQACIRNLLIAIIRQTVALPIGGGDAET